MINQKLYRITLVGVLSTLLWVGCASDETEIVPSNPNPPQGTDDDDDSQDDNRTYTTEQHVVDGITIEIYVPSDYNDDNRYPTLYFNDGDLYPEILGSLTGLEADPFIMVGLWDENDRATRFSPYDDDDLTAAFGDYTPSAVDYTQSLVDKVIPFVEALYPSSKKALFGISLGGLHATWAGIKYPGEFAFVGALSPSYWVGDQAIFRESLEDLRPMGISSNRAFYFDRGTDEWRNFMPFVENLQQVDLVYGQNIYYYEVIGGDHETPSWLLRIEVPFRLFMEGVGELAKLELNTYCADNLDEPGIQQARVNPVASFTNGVKYSVMPSADFEITSGDGDVTPDGNYTINSGSSISIQCTYQSLAASGEATICN